MGRVVHILATKLGSPLSCITPAKYDAKGAEAWRWFILSEGEARSDATDGGACSIDALPGFRMDSESRYEQIRHDCAWPLSAIVRHSFLVAWTITAYPYSGE